MPSDPVLCPKCGQPVLFAYVGAARRRMPFDATPVRLAVPRDKSAALDELSPPHRVVDVRHVYRPHWQRCEPGENQGRAARVLGDDD